MTARRFKMARFAVLLVALASGGATLTLTTACQNQVRKTEEGPRPTITKLARADGQTTFVATAETTDAGDLLACCSFNAVVTYDLEYRDFIEKAYVQWDDPRTRQARFEQTFEQPEDPGPDGVFLDASAPDGGESPRQKGTKSTGRTVSLQIDVPSHIAAKGVSFAFSVVLVTGQGAESLPARASVKVQGM